MSVTKEELIRGTKSEILEYFDGLNIISRNDMFNAAMVKNLGNRNFLLNDDNTIENQLNNMKSPMGIVCYMKETVSNTIKLEIVKEYVFVTDFQ